MGGTSPKLSTTIHRSLLIISLHYPPASPTIVHHPASTFILFVTFIIRPLTTVNLPWLIDFKSSRFSFENVHSFYHNLLSILSCLFCLKISTCCWLSSLHCRPCVVNVSLNIVSFVSHFLGCFYFNLSHLKIN